MVLITTRRFAAHIPPTMKSLRQRCRLFPSVAKLARLAAAHHPARSLKLRARAFAFALPVRPEEKVVGFAQLLLINRYIRRDVGNLGSCLPSLRYHITA